MTSHTSARDSPGHQCLLAVRPGHLVNHPLLLRELVTELERVLPVVAGLALFLYRKRTVPLGYLAAAPGTQTAHLPFLVTRTLLDELFAQGQATGCGSDLRQATPPPPNLTMNVTIIGRVSEDPPLAPPWTRAVEPHAAGS
jgi:hypothetical protein